LLLLKIVPNGDDGLSIEGRGRAGITALHWALIGVVALLALAAVYLFSRVALGPTRGYGMEFYPFFPLGFGLFGGFWILLIFAIPLVFLWPRERGPQLGSYPQDDALRILRERYAKGEITKEQFDQMTHDLTQIS
jgi:putative membrane protein